MYADLSVMKTCQVHPYNNSFMGHRCSSKRLKLYVSEQMCFTVYNLSSFCTSGSVLIILELLNNCKRKNGFKPWGSLGTSYCCYRLNLDSSGRKTLHLNVNIFIFHFSAFHHIMIIHTVRFDRMIMSISQLYIPNF